MVEPFERIRVVDLSTRPSGAFAARLFGDFGADVVLLETQHGHKSRFAPPFVKNQERGLNSSIPFCFYNWNKSSVVVRDIEQWTQWTPNADIVIATPEDEEWFNQIRSALNGEQVLLSITPHGLHGPLQNHPGNNLTMCARTGWAALSRYRDEPPLALPREQNGIVGGVAGFIAAAAALRWRQPGRFCEVVDVSELEAFALTVHPWGVATAYHGVRSTPTNRGGRPRGSPGPLWNLSDGRMNLGLADFHNWQEAMNVCKLPEQGARPELIPDIGRHSQDMRDVVHGLAETLPELKRWDVFHALAKLRCVIGVVQDMKDLTENDHLNARNYFTTTRVGRANAKVTGAPAKLSPSPWRIKNPAPLLDERRPSWPATSEVEQTKTRYIDYKEIEEGPLYGLKVLSFGQAWSGTFATELLALLGADVVQIASVHHPDAFRRISNVVPAGVRDESRRQHPANTQGHYNSVNLHKREIDLDLRSEKGREILWRLIPNFEVVVDNFRPSVLPSWGVTLERLNELRKGMIWASISGYGESGPYVKYPANGATTEPMAGFASVHGYLNDEGMNTGGLYPDPISGYFLVANILAAINHRDQTGEPQRIDLSMMEVVATTIGDWVMEYNLNGEIPKPQGNSHPLHAPHNVYQARDEQWLALATENEEAWKALVRHIDDDELHVQKFGTASERKQNEKALDEIIARWCIQQDAYEAANELGEIGVCAARVVSLAEIYGRPDPDLVGCEFLKEIDHPEAGKTWLPTRPWRFSSGESSQVRPAPCVGQHTQEVLEHELGMTAEEYEELVRDGITSTARSTAS